MQPVFQKVEANFNHSFYVEHMRFEYFPNPLHFHPDIEILFVLHGKGTMFVADSIESFGPGDIVMIGENTPHLWHSDDNRDRSALSEVIFILFKTDIFGEKFWQLPESKGIYKIIQLAQRGIRLKGKTRKIVSEMMRSMIRSNGFSRMVLLFTILNRIADNKEYEFLASPDVTNMINEIDSDRLNRVYEFVLKNYQRNITLEEVSEIANFSVPSFCRYFKKRTNKTFIRFLNEIRIAFACRLLIQNDEPVKQVCYSCGFTNVSYFIRQFRIITGKTPLSYRKKFAA